MLVVETIAKIRRAYFVQGKPIKAICRELEVSRKVVRKVLRSGATEFDYERSGAAAAEDRALAGGARPAAGGERGAVEPGAADADPGLRGAARARLRGRLRRGPALCRGLAAGARRGDGGGLRAAELRAGRGLPVRLEPRGRADRRRDGDGEGGACPALPQPDAVRAGLSAREPGDGVRRPRPGVRLLQGRLHARHLRQHEDGGGRDLRRQGARLQPPLPADVRPLPGRAGRLHAGARAGRRARSRTRSARCGSGSSRRGCG